MRSLSRLSLVQRPRVLSDGYLGTGPAPATTATMVMRASTRGRAPAVVTAVLTTMAGAMRPGWAGSNCASCDNANNYYPNGEKAAGTAWPPTLATVMVSALLKAFAIATMVSMDRRRAPRAPCPTTMATRLAVFVWPRSLAGTWVLRFQRAVPMLRWSHGLRLLFVHSHDELRRLRVQQRAMSAHLR